MQQKSDKEKLNLEQEKMKRAAFEENKFGSSTFQDQPKILENKENQNLPKEIKIIDLGVMGNARKRQNPGKEISTADNFKNETKKEANGENEEKNLEREEKRLKFQE